VFRYTCFGFVALLGLLPPSALALNTALVLDSEPGDYIGGGQNYYFTPADGTFSASRNLDNSVTVTFSNGSHNWSTPVSTVFELKQAWVTLLGGDAAKILGSSARLTAPRLSC